jgi:hypothetical protein
MKSSFIGSVRVIKAFFMRKRSIMEDVETSVEENEGTLTSLSAKASQEIAGSW